MGHVKIDPSRSLILFSSQSLNPWLALGLLAVGGWLVDSLLVALRLHQSAGDNLQVHLGHLWYVPLVLTAFVAVQWRRSAGNRLGLAKPRSVQLPTDGLRPAARALATDILSSEVAAALLAFLRKFPLTAQSAEDLAYRIGEDTDVVQDPLSHLVILGVVETESACGQTFYRLTRDPQRVAHVDELIAWQQAWRAQGRQLADAAGPSLVWGDWQMESP